MANNRLIIFCRGCGEGVAFAKHLGGEWYTDPRASCDNLDDFFTSHHACDFSITNGVANVPPEMNFSLATENDDEVQWDETRGLYIHSPTAQ